MTDRAGGRRRSPFRRGGGAPRWVSPHPELYGGFDGGDRVRVNGVSAGAPAVMARRYLARYHQLPRLGQAAAPLRAA
ncbi:hypothetical protein QQG74_18285 [Micromonospora sp. FIMYZ51]|uniref:hypothetical protein n=1 Tax=Micromonospora sp. FIMYZ51 TaxID=3051832 RepID=UPI00311E6D92